MRGLLRWQGTFPTFSWTLGVIVIGLGVVAILIASRAPRAPDAPETR